MMGWNLNKKTREFQRQAKLKPEWNAKHQSSKHKPFNADSKDAEETGKQQQIIQTRNRALV